MVIVSDSLDQYSRPTTAAEEEFYALHGDEQFAYTIGSVVLQAAWAIADLPGFMAGVLWLSKYIAFLYYIHFLVAFAIVFLLHLVLKTTAEVQLHYMLRGVEIKEGVAKKLDWKKAKTPILISFVLFCMSTLGLFMFEQTNGHDAVFVKDDNTTLLKEQEAINNSYASIESNIEKSYELKERSTLSSLDNKIVNLRAKKPVNNWHKGEILNSIASLKQKRDKLSNSLLKLKSSELDSLSKRKVSALNNAEIRFERQSSLNEKLNNDEFAKQQMSQNFGIYGSLILSLSMMLLYWGTQIRLSTINYGSGLFSKKKYKEPLLLQFRKALSDIMYRNGSNLITYIHKTLTPAKIKKADGTVGEETGSYHASTLGNASANQENATDNDENTTEAQQTASENATEAENAEAVITAAQQEAERLAKIETERIAAEKEAFEAEKQRLVDERADFEAKQREAKAEEERLMRERLAKLEEEKKAAEAERLQLIATAKEAEARKAQQELEKSLQLERQKQEREAKAQQEQKEKEERDRVAQQELKEKLAASETFSKLMEKIRTDLSNLRHDNGTFASITNRLNANFETLAILNTKKYLTDAAAKKLAARYEEYELLKKEKEVTHE